MNYEMEDLLPLAARLTDAYTSKESSSVPYDTARMLMGAVIYCISQCQGKNPNNALADTANPNVEAIYQKGYERVVEKVYQAKECYERLTDGFEDYGCQNYRDTLLKGMPAFFVNYDAKFNPQDHILTLDYPPLFIKPNLCGINLILEYLKNIEIEKNFLDSFDKQAVRSLLESLQPEYETLFLDNICHQVLLCSIGCMIADKPLSLLEISPEGCDRIALYFKGDAVMKAELKISSIIGLITAKMRDPKARAYLAKVSREYGARIVNAVQNDSLKNLFHEKGASH